MTKSSHDRTPRSSEELVDEIADQFETARQENPNIQIESFLQHAEPAILQLLTKELVRLEISFQIREGNTPVVDDFAERFPALKKSFIVEHIRAEQSRHRPHTPTTNGSSTTDLNLLRGITAFQNDFIDRDQLVSAMETWAKDKTASLLDILVELESLARETAQLVELLVQKRLEINRHNLAACLTDPSSIHSIHGDLQMVDDDQLQASLNSLSSVPSNSDSQFSTTPFISAPPSGERFQIVQFHAQGALGRVSIARDTEINRTVAVKQIQDKYADIPEVQVRFLTEAETTGRLEHPGIVPVYGLGHHDDGRPYYAMRLVKGDSLKKAIAEFHEMRHDKTHQGKLALELRKLLGRFVDVCEAVSYAHSRGVLHRDLKPGNIMLGKFGETLVVDWGLAKLVGKPQSTKREEEPHFDPTGLTGSSATFTGAVIGTPAYMSPEQAEGAIDKLGPASDVYSLGATLYCILTGEAPFSGESLSTIVDMVKTGKYPAPRTVNREVPAQLEAICRKAMALDSADRYESPHQLAEDVERWLADEPVGAWPEPLSLRIRRILKRHRTLVGSLSAAATVAIIALAVVTYVVVDSNQLLETANNKLFRNNEQLNVSNKQLEEAKSLANQQRTLAVESLVHALTIAKADSVPEMVEKLSPHRELVIPMLKKEFDNEHHTQLERMHAACGLSELGDVRTEFLLDAIPTTPPAECHNIARALTQVRSKVADEILARTQEALVPDRKFRFASVLLGLNDPRGMIYLLSEKQDRTTRTRLIHEFGEWCWDWSELQTHVLNSSNDDFQSGVALAIGILGKSYFSDLNRSQLIDCLAELYEKARGAGTHSAIDWAIRQWGEQPPEIDRIQAPLAGHDWFQNKTGITMVRIAGRQSDIARYGVSLQHFFLADREVSRALFQEFMEDPDYPEELKPEDWKQWRPSCAREERENGIWGPDLTRSHSLDCPAQVVNLYDIMLFCNWLSAKEGREPYYQQADYSWQTSVDGDKTTQSTPAWQCVNDSDGYRIPTLWEWRLAATEVGFRRHFGTRDDLLSQYAWFKENARSMTHPCAELIPSITGCFDLYGNINEYLWDRDISDGDFSQSGGSWNSDQQTCAATTLFRTGLKMRLDTVGFRVACSDRSDSEDFANELTSYHEKIRTQRITTGFLAAVVNSYEVQGDRLRDEGDFEAGLEWYDKVIDLTRLFFPKRDDYLKQIATVRGPHQKRMKILNQLNRSEETLDDSLTLLESENPASLSSMISTLRIAIGVAEKGDSTSAVTAAAKVEKYKASSPEYLAILARVYATSHQNMTRIPDPDGVDEVQLKGYLNRSVIHLAKAIQGGWKEINSIRNESVWSEVRKDARIQALFDNNP